MSIGRQGNGIPLSQVVQVGGSTSGAGGAAADRGAATDAATAARRSALEAATSAEQAKASAASAQQSQILAGAAEAATEAAATRGETAAQAAEMYANETAVDAASAAASAASIAPAVQNLQDQIDVLMATGVVAPPSGLNWPSTAPRPIFLRSAAGKLDCLFDTGSLKPQTTSVIWIAPSGNDSTGNGSEATPWRTLAKAFTEATARADYAVNIKLKAGLYNRLLVSGETKCNKDLVIESVGGPAILSTRFEPLTWTLGQPGTYSTTRSLVAAIWDETKTVSRQRKNGATITAPERMLRATSQAQCEATPHSFFISGSTVFVHTHDNRTPDAQVLVIASIVNLDCTTTGRWFCSGLEFEGARDAPVFTSSSAGVGANARLVFKDCIFRMGNGAAGNGASFSSFPYVLLENCVTYCNEQDGFNYHYYAQSGVAVEINCTGFYCGLADGNDNASTTHEDGKIIRFNGDYFDTFGGVVTDINTSMSWNLACGSRDSRVTGNTNANWMALDSAKMWLDTCLSSGGVYDYLTAGTAQIFTFNVTSLGRQAPGSNIVPYTPY